jgi:hypothetical protein
MEVQHGEPLLMATLIQIDGYDPAAAAAVSLCAASHDDPRLCLLNGQTWWPAIAKLPSLQYDLFDGAFAGQITAPTSSFTLSTEPWPLFGRYSLGDARVRIWTGALGADWSTYILRFDGRISTQPELADMSAEIDISVNDSWLDAPLLSTYAGTGGIEGTLDLTGAVKPLALGAPRYVPGTLIDSVNSVFQVSAYGSINAFEAALDELVRFNAAAHDYATLGALVAATIPPGSWATCKASGLARLGAPPAGQISFLVQGDSAGPDGWARKPGQIIRRIALISGGAGKINDASLNALDVACPWNLSVDVTEQTTARELIQSIAASVNAVAGISWTGPLFVAQVAIGAASVTLAADGTALPPVKSVSQANIDAPFWRLAIGAQRCWSVHSLSDIAGEASLVSTGDYDATRTNRDGDIVTMPDGSRWEYISDAPTAGISPPNFTYWASFDALAQTALDRLTAIESDSVLSAGEKPVIIRQWTQISDEASTIDAQADALGVSRANFDNARTALSTYLSGLSPAWNDTAHDTAIVSTTFAGKFTDYYFARTVLLTEITQVPADAATAALDDLAVIASDGYLSKGEKPKVVQDVNAIAGEKPTIDAKADALSISRTSYDAKYSALTTYLAGLAPAWNDETADTPIVRADFIAAFTNYQNAKIALLTSIAGQPGPAGASAVAPSLSKPAISVAAYLNGTLKAGTLTGAVGVMTVRSGATDVSSSSTFSVGTQSGCSVSIDGSGDYAVGVCQQTRPRPS